MYTGCLDKQKRLVEQFSALKTQEEKYKKIIEFGRVLPMLDERYRDETTLVQGCQSLLFLRSFLQEDKVFFEIFSEALISAGLAAILIQVYSGETPETVLKCPPDFLDQLGIKASLTPGRANGLYSMHLRMKQDALKLLMSHKQ